MITLFGIPVIFHTWFFLVLALLGSFGGLSGPEALLDIGLFVLAGTVSVMVHEFGHALVGRRFGGIGPVIHLHAMGGLCSFQRASFSRWQDFFMTLAGPAAGFALAAAAYASLLALPADAPPKFVGLVETTLRINVIWSVINLLPVLPLDGGRMVQAVLGPKRWRATMIVGLATSLVLIPLSWQSGFLILPFFLAYHAWQQFKTLQAMGRNMRRGLDQ